ncbi:GNAT family N-acetyltransferase [Metabacillus schmidteae]|uniref:GNAT family N-acetyltransferase n=1 Tax=Metabacillus schmidteae TaxID=2730405 RepID=UPI00158A4547|nr:GNAT family N-acetyltransferase [Metabacillus schmidteae]
MIMIRKASQDETNTLLYMTINVMSESTMGLVHNDVQKGMNMFVPLLNSGSYYLIAVDQHQIAGWVLMGPDFNPINVQKTGTITSLYVFPIYRKLGLGKQLMQSAIQQLKAEGYQKVQLNVFTGNPAKHLYEDLGFSDISTVMELKIT